MKLALGILLALSTLSSVSYAAVNACTVVKCGTYVQERGDDGVGLTIAFESTEDASKIAFSWLYNKAGQDDWGVRLVLTLADDGSFSAYEGTKLYASGACGNSSCTYGMIPILQGGKVLLQTGTFKFDGDNLEAAIYSPNSQGDDFVSKGLLKKQK